MDAVTEHVVSYHFLFMGVLFLPNPEIAFQQATNIHSEKISFVSLVLTEFFQENPYFFFQQKIFEGIQYIYEFKKHLSRTKSITQMINPLFSGFFHKTSVFKYNTMLEFIFSYFFPLFSFS